MTNDQLRAGLESKLRPGARYTEQDLTAFSLGVEWIGNENERLRKALEDIAFSGRTRTGMKESARKALYNISTKPCAHDMKPTGMYEPFDEACEKCGSFGTVVDSFDKEQIDGMPYGTYGGID